MGLGFVVTIIERYNAWPAPIRRKYRPGNVRMLVTFLFFHLGCLTLPFLIFRNVGVSAESHLVTHPNSSVAEVPGLLGCGVMDLRGHREFPKLEISPSDQKTGVKLVYRGQKKLFRPEQLVASVFNHLKRIVAEDSENKLNGINDNYFVLSAPNYFTDVERNALLDAAR